MPYLEDLRGALRRAVVIVLLGVWCFPATGLTAPRAPVPVADSSTPARPSRATEAAALAARERQAPALEDFRGGGVSIYIGSGVLVVVIVVLLVILLL
jgi:hypothetical protein